MNHADSGTFVVPYSLITLFSILETSSIDSATLGNVDLGCRDTTSIGNHLSSVIIQSYQSFFIASVNDFQTFHPYCSDNFVFHHHALDVSHSIVSGFLKFIFPDTYHLGNLAKSCHFSARFI
jgi:hypothetical protein